MSSEPDVFKKLDALLNKHRQTDAAASPDEAIPTLLEVVDETQPSSDSALEAADDDALPVLTDMIGEDDSADTLIEDLELDLEFIPDDGVGPLPEPLMAAELPDVWERNEHEFDAETTHGFGLSAFSREAAAEAREWIEPLHETADARAEDRLVEPAQAPEHDPDITDAPTTEPATQQISEQMYDLPAASPPSDLPALDPGVAGLPDDIPADDWGNPTAEVAISDALAERALRDLDRHIAAVLESQVGPQIAHRLDAALASMLEQFSTNLESLIREAVRDEMRRYFDGDGQ